MVLDEEKGIDVKASELIIKKIKDKETGADKIEVLQDKRKLTTGNRFVHGGNMDLPAYCDNCVLRPKDKGGSGACKVYEPGAACILRKDLKALIDTYDTRSPETLNDITDQLIKMKLEDVYMAQLIARMEGNLPDKSARSELNSLMQLLKLKKDLAIHEVTISQTVKSDGKGGIEEIMRAVMIKKQQEIGNSGTTV